ncbi:hypothetical protein H6P81_011806 [Aristolochia fimbriata]|uniref:Uncharacterized protein n=1 Tax=Aristolochia fimbriata TaxID=158543 RepID=A0AAV7EAD8_ARIFI|nr:hypothetical protein H6P81_011806 [Aristolochia fimbriata]
MQAIASSTEGFRKGRVGFRQESRLLSLEEGGSRVLGWVKGFRVGSGNVLGIRVGKGRVLRIKVGESRVLRIKVGESRVLRIKVGESRVLRIKVGESRVLRIKVGESRVLGVESAAKHSMLADKNKSQVLQFPYSLGMQNYYTLTGLCANFSCPYSCGHTIPCMLALTNGQHAVTDRPWILSSSLSEPGLP